MVIGLISAIVAGPAILGITEGVRVGQSNNKRDEHRGRRCNLIVTCVSQSEQTHELSGRQVFLQDGKLYIVTSDGKGHPFEGYYVPYPETNDEGLVSSIDDRQPPMLNWIYVDLDTYQVKYGVRAQAQPNLKVPFDCTRYDKRLTLQGWEGFVAVEEESGVWALYFDKDRDSLRDKSAGKQVLQVQLTRSERREGYVFVEKAQAQKQAMQEKDERIFRFRTGAATLHDFKGQKKRRMSTFKPVLENLQVTFDPPFDSMPLVAVGLTQIEEDNKKNMRLQMTANKVDKTGFEAHFIQWFDSTIYEVGASWFATVDPDFQIGNFVTSEVRPYTRATQKTQKRISFRRRFKEPPKVVCWLNYLDLRCDLNPGSRFGVRARASDIHKDSFVIHVDGWGSSMVANAGACWIAFPADKSGIDKGIASTALSVNEPETSKRVAFHDGAFQTPPGRVKVGLCGIDLDNIKQTGLRTEVGSFDGQGFDWKTKIWPGNRAGAQIAWIALE